MWTVKFFLNFIFHDATEKGSCGWVIKVEKKFSASGVVGLWQEQTISRRALARVFPLLYRRV